MTKRLEQMIRVDHAGEHGAVKIYEGQAAVFGASEKTKKAAELVREMAAQEQSHMDHFDALIVQRRIRPTVMAPLWDMAGFALGAGTALMGEKAAMACTAAVEEVIDDHYSAQIEELKKLKTEPELLKKLEKFRAEEAEHRHTALENGAAQAPFYRLMSKVIKAGCQTAIKVSEKI
ncbi:MAG: demethoxyubiquinone hydroxylase family protein [Parvibaculales bacterium]